MLRPTDGHERLHRLTIASYKFVRPLTLRMQAPALPASKSAATIFHIQVAASSTP